jgi:exonuclease SbcD
MRLLHTSDWHLGRRLHGAELLEEQAGFLEWLLDVAREHRVDAVLVSGDVYDRAQPGADAIRLVDDTLAAFARAGVPMVVTSGNHDSAVRLQYGGQLLADSGIHLRTTLEQVAEPVLLADAHGSVGIYGIPYLLPDAVTGTLGVDRSHGAVLGALVDRIRCDAAERGLARVVVMAHAFVTGASASDSEREIRVGGVGDTPADVFDGVSYVALGHLHGPQQVDLAGSRTTLAYSGSPLPFSFSERSHAKSVTLVELDEAGAVALERLPVPQPRPMVQVTGRLEELLGRATCDLGHLAAAWVKVVLTDPGRVASPMEQLRAVWPHTLALEFAPEGEDSPLDGPLDLTQSSDPVDICATFVEAISGEPPTDGQRAILAEAVRECQRAEAVA